MYSRIIWVATNVLSQLSRGTAATISLLFFSTVRCVWIAPLGRAVVPDVYKMTAG
jgi:hypothetical protein